MSKRPARKNGNTKPAEANTLPDTHWENNSHLVEMAAEQLADLLWRHWLYMKGLERKSPKEPDF